MANRIWESCPARFGVWVSVFVYPFCSKHCLMVGMSLLVMKLSSFLPFRVGGHSGGVSVWVSRLMALRSPAVPIRYLPFTHILDVSALRVFTCVVHRLQHRKITKKFVV